MTIVPAETLTAALRWRYATKKFDPARKIPAETWKALEESLVLTPSSYGLQPWKFIVVTDRATCEKLSAVSWGQKQPAECSHYVVFAGRRGYGLEDLEHFMDRTVEVRGVPRESLKGYGDLIAGSLDRAAKAGTLDAWMGKQSYIALGQFMASAALLGIDTCPMEGIEQAKYDEILGLAALGYGTLCACAAGYRSASDRYSKAAKVRFNESEVIVHV
ncbi:MAG TPA: NAD(P)H-dependent oxidoreductase [Opitutaceae bacterium]